ncbi:hypothetical protein K435DRAFT_972667 [Dendrothele bispora CBS 962.96]|uniref:Uncharacterized protein n=1 Tax=Dendrothele bispora (strain CBS 962.96) TaxID=1314807 RepID=A0A4S8KXT3_DENBC|nr:hypothetical protein K435DRAFT_972667 [Dendrothele bispora CBS 962.96]
MSLEDLNHLQDEIINSDPRDPFRKFFVDTPLWESLKFEVLKRIMSRLDVLKRQNLASGGLGVAAGAGIISSTVPTHPSSSVPDSRTRQTSRSAQNTTRSHSASRDVSSIIDHDLRQVRTQMEQIDSRVEGLLFHLRSLIPDVSQIQQACQRIENIGSVGDAGGTAILCGGLAFGTSAVCLSVSTQPFEVWVPTVVACSCVIVLPSANVLLKYFNFRLPSVFDTI